mmetsp:Transcript_39479/g.72832  ORF Transcript_39479/g.72832 Transcript_39479/m.72832 type:complete len:131 (-) Transcript_39479:1431-1823(-)
MNDRTKADLNRQFRRNIARPGTYYRRIEDSAGLGTYDGFAVEKGTTVWLELKMTGTPGQKPDLRMGQAAFGSAIIKHGGLAYLIVGDRRRLDVRVLWGKTNGDDWRDYLLYEGPLERALWQRMLRGDLQN